MIVVSILLTLSVLRTTSLHGAGAANQDLLDNVADESFLPPIHQAAHQEDQDATNFEIKAIMTKCPRSKLCDCETAFQCSTNETGNADSGTEGFRSNCEGRDLETCDKEISLTLKIKNRGRASSKPQYIILDHVFDPVSYQKKRLLNSYVLKVTQRPVYQVYDLVFENVVNSGPIERVVNKRDPGYTGCSTEAVNPTCRAVKYHEIEVPYSTGFCCSCDSHRDSGPNEILNDVQAENRPNKSISNFAVSSINPGPKLRETNNSYLPGHCKVGDNHYGQDSGHRSIKNAVRVINAQNLIKDGPGGVSTDEWRADLTKDVPKKNLHPRGGQDCDDAFVPLGADSKTYHDSAHCMEFSEVWYSVYKIAHPTIDHSVDIQIFEKLGTEGNRIYSKELTSYGKISVGTSEEKYSNSEGTIVASYTMNTPIEGELALDLKDYKLLIPEGVGSDSTEGQYPEVAGGPSEYLVTRESDIDVSGTTCNKAGVGYEAFANQPNKCNNRRNACLQNQPRHMWQHDHDLHSNGKKGRYFLKNFGALPDNPVQTKFRNGTSKEPQNKLLLMYYLGPVLSNVNINFAADTNAILKSDELAMITEVYTDSLNPKRVSVTAKIFNSGLVSSVFFVRIGACPLGMPAGFRSISSQPVIMSPQHQHTFTLDIYCELPLTTFYCSLEVLNLKQQLVAARRIRFTKEDRCFCLWYCQCSCFSSDYRWRCIPFEIEEYYAAGFQGGMPIPTQVVKYSAFDDAISLILHIVLYFCLTLWYMGLVKAGIGICVLPIGLCGLDKIFDLSKELNKYYESNLKDQKVVYDDEGWPIHPETGRKVHNLAPATQFAINMVFFFVFPFAITWNVCRKLLEPRYPSEKFGDLDICHCRASHISLLKERGLQNATVKRSRQGHSVENRDLQHASSEGINNSSPLGSKGFLCQDQ
ncbi:hapless 2 isoform X2 [Euwallacea fornicatus]|uniref:hapless 2 isoform X2 n=1 Tax=Euwallacea fornicatus TaxID=995702 RepID=UPI00339008DA